MREIWVVESYSRNMRPTAFEIDSGWTIDKIAESKRLADAWREDQEEIQSFHHETGYQTKYRTIRYVPDEEK